MSFRDWIDRLTGRGRPRRYTGAVRLRSDPTIQLPPEEAGADAPVTPRSVTAPENAAGPVVRPYSEPTPALGAPPGASVQPGPVLAPPGGPEAPTEYFRDTGNFKNGEVVGVVVVIDGELKGQLFPVMDGENKLGRATDCDIVLASKWISREHAMVVHNEGVFAIVPLTEKNRTYVNDREVDGSELADGDSIRLGRSTFRFRSIEGL